MSPDDESTNMQTKLRPHPRGERLRVGDHLDIALPDVEAAYLKLREPVPGEPIRILETWECPACGRAFNWAEVVLDQWTIASIDAKELTHGVLDRAHFVTPNLDYVYESLTGVPLYLDGVLRSDFKSVLRAALPLDCD